MPDITGKKTLRSVARTGMVAPVSPLLAWAGLGTGFVIALAAVLRMAGSVPEGDHVTGAIRLPGPVTAAILALFGLALVVFLGNLVRRALSKRNREDDGAPVEEPTPVPPWLRRVTLLLSLVNVAVLAYLWRRAVLEGGLFVGTGGLASGLGLPDMEALTAPALFNLVFASLAVLAGLPPPRLAPCPPPPPPLPPPPHDPSPPV